MYKTQTIDTIIALKQELDKKIPIKAENEKRLKKKFRLEFNYNSNHLEGNTLSYGQTQLLLYFGKSSGDVSVSDIEEMKAHDVALSQIEEMAKDNERPLTEMFIKELNETILVKPFWKDAISPNGSPTRKKIEIGQYKTSPNSVMLKNGETHEYASPEETPAFMSDLLSWYNKNKEILHPVQLAAEFHYRFVCIHPFDDGNGRVARLIMNYIMFKNNYPPVIIKTDDKEGYLTALQKADTGDLLSLMEYIEKQAIWSLKLSIKAAKGEDIDELGDIEKEIEILKREKLTKTKIFKTTKVAFELIKHITEDLWIPLNKVLVKFDDFFAESKVVNYVNDRKIERTRTIPNPITKGFTMLADKEVTIIPHEIFGYDLDEDEVYKIQWVKKFMSLKSAKIKTDFIVHFLLELNNSQYRLVIYEGDENSFSNSRKNTILFEIENEYKTFFMNDTIESIVRIVSKYIIRIIKLDK